MAKKLAADEPQNENKTVIPSVEPTADAAEPATEVTEPAPEDGPAESQSAILKAELEGITNRALDICDQISAAGGGNAEHGKMNFKRGLHFALEGLSASSLA